MINRKKILDISSVGLTEVISSGIAVIFWFYIAAVIGPEKYGELTYLLSIAGLVSALALFGSGSTITVFSAKNIDIQKTLYSISLTLNVIGAIVIFILFLDLSLSFVIIGFSLSILISSDLLGKKLYKKYSKYIISQKILLLFCSIGFYYLIGESGIIIGIALSHGIFFIQLIKTMKISKFNFKFLKEKKNFILNSFALSVNGAFNGSIDKLIIAPLLGFTILGNYSLGLQFFAILSLLPSASLKYLIPQDATGNPNKKLKSIIVFTSIGFAILGSTVGPFVISSIFPKFIVAADLIRIISWAIIPSTITNVIFYSKFWAHEMNRKILFSSITTLISQVLGIIILGPIYGINGIAAALVIGISCGTIFAAISDKFK